MHAKTYALNTAANSISVLANLDTDFHGIPPDDRLVDSLELAHDVLGTDIPDVPILNEQASEETRRFCHLLGQRMCSAGFQNVVPNSLASSLIDRVDALSSSVADTQDNSDSSKVLVDPDTVVTSFGIDGLFDNPQETVNKQMDMWGSQKDHPPILPQLARSIDLKTTNSLLSAVFEDFFNTSMPVFDSTVTRHHKDYHLLWMHNEEAVHYKTPAFYDIATQLSFDLPHNAAHLLHLQDMIGEGGVYTDNLIQRADFESVALLSEYLMAQTLTVDSSYAQNASVILNMHPEDFVQWVVADRYYEFKLRTARFLGDALLSSGEPYGDVVPYISEELEIPISHADAEVRKYLPWLGLNAVYIKGYMRFVDNDIDTVQQAINFIK